MYGKIQVLFKVYVQFSSTFLYKFGFQGLFKTAYHFQVLFKTANPACVLGAQKNRLIERVLLSTHNYILVEKYENNFQLCMLILRAFLNFQRQFPEKYKNLRPTLQ